MAIVFSHELEDPQAHYAFNKIIYVRGTKEGYKKIKPQVDDFFLNKNVQNGIALAGRGIQQRYLDLRRQLFNQTAGGKLRLKDDELIKLQEDYVKQLSVGLSKQQTTADGEKDLVGSVGSTLKAMQGAVWTSANNTAKAKVDAALQYIDQLETIFKTMSPEEQLNLIGLINAGAVEGNIININEQDKIFSRFRGTLARLSALDSANLSSVAYQIMTNINREAGALGEVTTIWAANLAMQELEQTINKNKKLKLGSGKFIQTGSQKSRKESGSISTAKADSIFSYSGRVNNNKKELTLEYGISIKTTGSIVDSGTGEWKAPQPKDRPKKIQIASITQREAIWRMLTVIFGSGVKANNAMLNALAWENGNSKIQQIIKKSLVAYYFEKMLAGSGGEIGKTGSFDIVDCLIVNQYPIPVVDILAQVVKEFEKGLDGKGDNHFIFVNLHADNTWKGDPSKPNRALALERSKSVADQIMNNLKMTVALNGNILYNIAKHYF